MAEAIDRDQDERTCGRPIGARVARRLWWPFAFVKYRAWQRVERHVLRLRGVHVDRTAVLSNVRFAGPAVVEACCRLRGNPEVRLGRDVHIGPHTHVQGDIHLGDGVWVGPRVVMWGRDHGVAAGTPIRLQPRRTEPIRIGSGAKIGPGAVILRGVRVGEGATVGAGAVCTRDVPAGSVVRGSPARAVGPEEAPRGAAETRLLP